MPNIPKILTFAPVFLCVFLNASCWSVGSNERAENDGKWETISASSPNASRGSTDETSDTAIKGGGFAANLPAGFTQPFDEVGRRLLREYGAVFVARGGVTPPGTVVFKNDDEVAAFQSGVESSRASIAGISVELQSAAMKAIREAIAEAAQSGTSIKPRGTDASKRNYQDTVGLWASRVEPGLTHWSGAGRISAADAQRIRSLPPYEQVSEIFKLEARGIYFSKDMSKSIIYSVAPPGSSQHLSMLALDVSEHDDSKVRAILAKHGWFQTVVSDMPHFTYLGVQEAELSKLGLKKVSEAGRSYWVPEI